MGEARLAKASEDYLMLVITTKQDGIIGYMFLRNPKECANHVHLEVSFLLGQSFQNQGYMAEALKSVSTYAFREWGVHRLHAYAFSANIGSCKALENAGFRKVDVIFDVRRNTFTKPGSPCSTKYADCIVYGLARS